MSRNGDIFNIDLPPGWADETVCVFRGPKVGEKEHMVILAIDRESRYEGIEEMAFAKTAPVLEALGGAEVLKNEEITVEGGNPAWELVYKWIPAEGIKVFCRYVMVMSDGMGFTFSAEFTKQTLKTVGAQMKQVIGSLLPGTFE